MTVETSTVHSVGMSREQILFYQFVDPMRDRVPLEDRVDLENPPKHNGKVTFVVSPGTFAMPPGFELFNWLCREHSRFHRFIQDNSIWTLAYSEATHMALTWLIEEDPNIVIDLAIELYPSYKNAFLGRAHGRPGTYTAGCRGPLCRAANTKAQRERYLGKTPELDRRMLEAALSQVTVSYEAYISYVKQVRAFRREIRDGGQTHRIWTHLSLRDTILIDVTDESYLM